MRLLLDTRVWLWAISAPERLSDAVRDQLASGESFAELSTTSWELDGLSGRLMVLAPPTAHRALSQRFAGAGK